MAIPADASTPINNHPAVLALARPDYAARIACLQLAAAIDRTQQNDRD
jgi:hypothetical protein